MGRTMKTDTFSWMTSMSVWLAFCMTTMLVMSRVSLLWLLRLYKYEQIHPVTWYLVVFILLGIPHIFNLIYILWDTPIISAANRQPFPKALHVIIGVLSSVLEGVATAMFATEVVHVLPETVLLTLPFATLTFLILKDVLSDMKKSSNQKTSASGVQKWCSRIVKCLNLAVCFYTFAVASAVGTVLCIWSQFGLTLPQCIVLSVCILLLSSTWCPVVQKMSILAHKTGKRCSTVDLFYIPIKIISVAIALFLSLFFKVSDFRNHMTDCIVYGLVEISNLRIWLAVVFCCFGGFLSFMTAVASSKVGLITPGMEIPMFLCPPLAIFTTAVLWNDFETDAFWEINGSHVYSLIAIGLCVVAWLIPFVLPIFRAFGNPEVKDRPLKESFYSFSWSPFFLEPRMILNFERKSVSENILGNSLSSSLSWSGVKTLFICTTMYKESEIEMKRYLKSIKNVFENNDSDKLKLEAHVFFDSSVVDDKINTRGRHLLSLLCETFHISASELTKLSSPYGCQIHTRELLNHPVYFHFKDASKVKAKKRWSQVMYMHYVLKFRTSNMAQYPHDHPMDDHDFKVDEKDNFHFEDDFIQPHLLPFSTCNDGMEFSFDIKKHWVDSKSSCSEIVSEKDVTDKETNGSTSGFFSCDTQTSSDCLSTNTFSKFQVTDKSKTLDEIFLLTTDADTEFSSKSIGHVLEQCQKDPTLGAVCGRTVPIGSAKPIVWYQKFEYAKDFWLVKSSQNVIGSVTCCPGCFSVYRGEAVAAIAEEFSQPPTSGFDKLVMDHGEDRWLCTLLMQKGWRLAYSSHAHNSTHCPETVGEFLRQRRRWVLSELSNMAAIFMSVTTLVQNNSSFSGMFLISLFTTFLWVILSPSTTLVFMCAGMDVLYSVPMKVTLPLAAALFIGYCAVCCLASQSKQKLISIAMTLAMALMVMTLGVGFIMYVVNSIQADLHFWGFVQFRPYFLVFLLVISIVYAALLHPRESLSLVYGLSYALLFPAMFVVLPVYALANMLDQSWGTREAGTHGCCQSPEVEDDENAFSDFSTTVSSLPSLSEHKHRENESTFWRQLQKRYIGNDVNIGKSAVLLSRDLYRMRKLSVFVLVMVNLLWFSCLSVLYAYAGSDVICYCIAAVFSFSLLVQLTGLSCYKLETLLKHYLQNNMNDNSPKLPPQ